MGAWGLGLFESNHDMHIVEELNCEVKLVIDDIVNRSLAQMAIDEENSTTDDTAANDALAKSNCTLYAKLCSNVDWVRIRIEKDPSITTHSSPSDKIQLINKYTEKTLAQNDLRNPYGAAYRTVILGACLMSLGCTLPDDFKTLLRRIYPDVGLMRDAIKQMEAALAPNGFKDGTPYDFGSYTEEGVQDKPGGPAMADRLYPDSCMINVPAPNDAATAEQESVLDEETKQHIRDEKNIIWAAGHAKEKVCSGCHTTDGDKRLALKLCSKCGMVKYCGRDCQVKDWTLHKGICKTLKEFKDIPAGADIFIGQTAVPKKWKDRLIDPISKEVGKNHRDQRQ